MKNLEILIKESLQTPEQIAANYKLICFLISKLPKNLSKEDWKTILDFFEESLGKDKEKFQSTLELLRK